MLYGRRFRYTESRFTKTTSVRKEPYLRKNAVSVAAIVLLVSCLFFVPTYHFVSENFKIFMSLAFEYQPSLVQHLERELSWIQFFISAAVISFVGFSAVFYYHSLRAALNPLDKLSQHFTILQRGYYHTEELKVEQDDFKALADNYSEFHRSLKNKTEEELTLLKKIHVDENNKDSLLALKKLIQLKEEQLGLDQTTENVVNLNEYDRQRRAS